jgi:hypothetical protein
LSTPSISARSGLQRCHLHTECTQILSGLLDFRLVRRDEQVIAVLGAFLGEIISDPGRGAGDDREAARFRTGFGHARFF